MSINSAIPLGISSHTQLFCFFAVVTAIYLLDTHAFKSTSFVSGFVTFSFDIYILYMVYFKKFPAF